MKILITGASGFIGRLLSECLIKTSIIIPLDKNKSDKSIDCDLSDFHRIEDLFIEYSIDVIIHCAGIAHQKIGSIDSNKYFRINSIATENLAKAAIKANPDVHFIFLSSISVYGEDNIKGSVSEDAECKPSSDYAYSKLDAEKRLIKMHEYREIKKLDILRLAPVYDSDWCLNLDRRVFAPKKMAYVKFGSGKQEMSAVSRRNLVDFIYYRLKQEEDNLTGVSFCNIFNVCDEKNYKFEDMIRVFKQSKYHPNKFVVRVPLSLVWIATRLAGLVSRNKRQWLHSCYDKLAYSLVFDNKRMLDTGYRPKHNLESVFLEKKGAED